MLTAAAPQSRPERGPSHAASSTALGVTCVFDTSLRMGFDASDRTDNLQTSQASTLWGNSGVLPLNSPRETRKSSLLLCL